MAAAMFTQPLAGLEISFHENAQAIDVNTGQPRDRTVGKILGCLADFESGFAFLVLTKDGRLTECRARDDDVRLVESAPGIAIPQANLSPQQVASLRKQMGGGGR